jgi:transcriptional regulator with XRE-family HTH domain
MPVRRSPLQEARRTGDQRWRALLLELRRARMATGLSQRAVAAGLGVSRPLLSQWERGRGAPHPATLVAWAAAVGLDLPLRAYAAGPLLHDAGQLRYLGRAQTRIGSAWGWQTEVTVSRDPRDRRAIDAVIRRDGVAIGLEVISRLTDAQAQVRAALQKQEAAGLIRMLLVLADTRHNRIAVAAARFTLEPAFPVGPRRALADLRGGITPPANGFIFV